MRIAKAPVIRCGLLLAKHPIYAIHSLDDCFIRIAGMNFTTAEYRQIGATRIDAGSPARRVLRDTSMS